MATYRSWTLPDIKTHPHSLPVAAQLHSATNEIVKFLPNTPLAIVGDGKAIFHYQGNSTTSLFDRPGIS